MKLRYLPLGVVAFGIVLVGSASQVNADIPGSDACDASGTWVEDGLVVVAETDGGVYTIPDSDIVEWEGSVAAPPGEYSGAIWLEMPPPFGKWNIDDWDGDSDDTSNFGSYDYEMPSWVPAGVEFDVKGEHSDENGSCSGTIAFELDGGPFDSPATPIALGGTVLLLILTALALKPLF